MNISDSIIAVLAYHGIFSYPLKADEIHKYQTKKATFLQTEKTIKNLLEKKTISKKDEFYFLGKNQKLVTLRKSRQRISEKKFKRANFYANILRSIPTIKLVAISGALAMQNSSASDDIDFFIICQKNCLWTTRFMANLALLPFKREPKSRTQKDKACLNLFLDEQALTVKEQNLYTAHEICQLNVLWDRNNTYQKFLKANSWTKKYLPNWVSKIKTKRSKSRGSTSGYLLPGLWPLVESFLKFIQLNYMKSKITSEKIGDHQLFFHPEDTQKQILKKYSSFTRNLDKNRLFLR